MTSTGLTPSGSVPRPRDMALIIDLAFSEFERRTYECLSEAQEKIVREAETAHEYCMLQLSQLRNSILKTLSDYEKQSGAMTNAHHKRARPIEDGPAGRRKKAKYSIADAWDDINAEAKKNERRLAAKKNVGTAVNKGKRTNASYSSEGGDYEESLEEQSDEEKNGSLGEEDDGFDGEEESGSGSEESGSGSEGDGGSGSEEDGGSEGAEEDEFEDEEEVESEGSARGEESG